MDRGSANNLCFTNNGLIDDLLLIAKIILMIRFRDANTLILRTQSNLWNNILFVFLRGNTLIFNIYKVSFIGIATIPKC